MTTKFDYLTREEVFELLKLYAEKSVDAMIAGNKEIGNYCDTVRKAFIEELKERKNEK